MSQIVVKKFGGTSLASASLIRHCAKLVHDSINDVVVVVSAMSGATNNLLKQVSEFKYSEISVDMVISTGEQVAAGLFAAALGELGSASLPMCGWQVPIRVDNKQIVSVGVDKIKALLERGCIPVITGFQGIDPDGNITTLPRGGSDTTAVAIAAALGVECEIYTDVDGVYKYDPNLIQDNNFLYSAIDYETMLTMSYNGAKVIHSDAVAIAKKNGVKIRILSSFNPGAGTTIYYK